MPLPSVIETVAIARSRQSFEQWKKHGAGAPIFGSRREADADSFTAGYLSALIEANWIYRLPAHECSLTLEHNPHRDYHDTILQWEETTKACMNADNAGWEETGWVSEEQRAKAITEDSLWVMQWYPHTPAGFKRLFAADLEVLLKAAADGKGA